MSSLKFLCLGVLDGILSLLILVPMLRKNLEQEFIHGVFQLLSKYETLDNF